MIRHTIGNHYELLPHWVCDMCYEPIADLVYAEIVWTDASPSYPTRTIFGHTQCTRGADLEYSNNMNAKEYLEKLI